MRTFDNGPPVSNVAMDPGQQNEEMDDDPQSQ